ncbi:helix-turn-helix domain-containing protein [Paracoccus contaminans]|uniref:DNA binding HTH domain-containing protein n=1 Tax=Paracoccus contaminans TaxID=1945662 RepID=A0A1W6CUW6_9RHOB|nr:helix-turn-helix domain-containing protein [Paracoccus contaminans]ARJ68650.1 hypothetical protein B0A89_02350 [Paracoccus contaminans]
MQTIRPPIARRSLLLSAPALLAARIATGAEGPLRFGLTPVFLNNEAAVIDALTLALADASGRPVLPVQRRSYAEVTALHRLFPAVNARAGGRLRGIAALTEAAVRAHDWPGNGRELRARLIRGVEHAAGDWLFPADLFPERQTNAALQSLAEARDAAERAQIMVALERSGHQMAEAARLLKVSRTTLWEKIQKLGLQPVRISERQ